MNNLLAVERYKIKHSKGFKVMICLSAFCGVISAIFFSFATQIGSGVSLSGYEAFYAIFSDLRSFGLIFAGVFSGIFIGEDFSCRAFQAKIALGNSRFSILMSKTVVYLIGLVFMICTWQLVVTVGVTLINGFGVPMTFLTIFNMIRATFMFSFHLCVCSMLCVLTSIMIKSKGTIMAVNILLLLIVDGLFQVFSMLHEIGFEVYSKTPLIHALLFSAPNVLISDMISSLVMGFTVMTLLFLGALMMFKHVEFK